MKEADAIEAWRCPDCRCHSCAEIHGSPGMVRCINCKRVYPLTPRADRTEREAIARVIELVNRREQGVQKDRENAKRSATYWTEEDLARERQYATVASVSLADLQAVLAALRPTPPVEGDLDGTAVDILAAAKLTAQVEGFNDWPSQRKYDWMNGALAAINTPLSTPVEVGAIDRARVDWRLPYRSMDAAGDGHAAGNVALRWIEEMAEFAQADDPGALSVETCNLVGDGRATALYRGPNLLAVATVFRDPMNFAVLVRWLSEEALAALSTPAASGDEL